MYSVAGRRAEAHSEAVWAADWSRGEGPNANRIATGGLDNKVRVWSWSEEAGEAKCETTLEGAHQLGVISVHFSPDGRLLASASTESAIKVWEAGTGEAVASIDAGPHDSWTARFSPDGTKIATGSHNGKVNIYEVPSGAKGASLETGGKFVLSVAWAPNGELVAAATQEGIVYVLDVASGTLLHTIEAHALPTRTLAFTPDSALLVSGADDGYVKIHDVASTASLVASLPGHSAWVLHVDADPKGRLLASASSDASVKVWELGERRLLHSFQEHEDQVWAVAFNGAGNRLCSVSEDKALNVYSLPV